MQMRPNQDGTHLVAVSFTSPRCYVDHVLGTAFNVRLVNNSFGGVVLLPRVVGVVHLRLSATVNATSITGQAWWRGGTGWFQLSPS
jgi:hypothetical protein